jgi:hypothetical protein
VLELVVSDFFAGVDDVDSEDELLLDDDPESPFFESGVDVDEVLDDVDDDLPRLSVL